VKPIFPVMQKSHASAQPTCEDTQTTYFSSKIGIRTASTRPPSGDSKRYFTKPSAARRRSTTCSRGSVARSSSASRTARGTWGAHPTSSTERAFRACTAAKTFSTATARRRAAPATRAARGGRGS